MNSYLAQHPYLVGSALTFIGKYVIDAFISSLEAPTASSGPFYRFFFKFANKVAANWSRANNTAVESSPNFQAALDVQTNIAGVPSIDVKPVDAVPAKM